MWWRAGPPKCIASSLMDPEERRRIIHLAGWYEMLERAKHRRNLPICATGLANDLARTFRG
jgi:hypothetical protein